MRMSVLASGSRANCVFLEVQGRRVLVDCGLSTKQIELRLEQIGVEPRSIEAVLITHEHSDHIAGVRVFTNRYKIPCFANAGTAACISSAFACEEFETGSVFSLFNGVSVHPFSITHDAADPVGFAITCDDGKIVVATDIGKTTPLLEHSIREAHMLVLESNFEDELLYACDYPWQVKQRISSSHGHLSNEESAGILKRTAHEALHVVVLGHLSEHSNTPEHALRRATRALRGTSTAVRLGNPYRPSEVFHVNQGLSADSFLIAL